MIEMIEALRDPTLDYLLIRQTLRLRLFQPLEGKSPETHPVREGADRTQNEQLIEQDHDRLSEQNYIFKILLN